MELSSTDKTSNSNYIPSILYGKKVAVVGTSINMTDNEERDVRQFIAIILKRYDVSTTIIISGGAKGVDTIALEVASGLGFKTKVYRPDKQEWYYLKKRNLEIAKDCDELHCISVPVHKLKCYHHDPLGEHEKTAGCWTMKQVYDMGKPCQLVVTLQR